jgi:transposase InsO family protein
MEAVTLTVFVKTMEPRNVVPVTEAKIIIEGWRRNYKTKRPHSSLGYRPSASEFIQWPASPPGTAPPATPAVVPRPVMH